VTRWERVRDFLAGREGYVGTALHRSLAPEAEFRFVNVARWRSPRDFQAAMAAPGFPGRQLLYVSHPALYQVVAEDDAPVGPDPAGSDPAGLEPAGAVLLINLFEVPASDEDDFMSSWEQARSLMRARPGYLGTRLHCSLAPDAEFRFVNIAAWPSAGAFQAAIDDPAFSRGHCGDRGPGAPVPLRGRAAVAASARPATERAPARLAAPRGEGAAFHRADLRRGVIGDRQPGVGPRPGPDEGRVVVQQL
jgi:heme-degrading monooxygenase HmoA